jgi:DNA-binding NarL/FixJ family response regulator
VNAPIRIMAVDDHVVLREALCDLLAMEPDLEIVAQVGSGPEAVRMAAVHKPDVVLLDIEMPDTDPVATVRQLLADSPSLHIVVLSMYDDPALVQELVSLGIGGYLHKSSRRQTVVSAIRQAGSGTDTVTVSVSPRSLRAAPERHGRPAFRAGAGNPQRGGRRAQQPADRRAAGHHRTDRQAPPAQHLREAGRRLAHRRGEQGHRAHADQPETPAAVKPALRT